MRATRGLGLEALTLYAFSSENWRRSAEEISDLMGLLKRFILSDIDEIASNGVRLKIIGDYAALAPDIVALLDDAVARTAGNSVMTLVIALNYGSQQEIARAAHLRESVFVITDTRGLRELRGMAPVTVRWQRDGLYVTQTAWR